MLERVTFLRLAVFLRGVERLGNRIDLLDFEFTDDLTMNSPGLLQRPEGEHIIVDAVDFSFNAILFVYMDP